ncbi:MAG: TlpA family protein disulfide reductase [Bacillota bacterium]
MSEAKYSRVRFVVMVLALVGITALVAGCGGLRKEQDASPGPAAAQQPAPQPAEQPASKSPTAAEAKPLPGYRAPSFSAVDVFTGEKVTLADLKGQVVFLNFWATWCPPCKAEMPEMEQLHQEMGDKVRIVALGADARESPEKMAAFAKEMGLTFTIAHDRGMAVEPYRVTGIPTSFFIDRAGIIRARYPGALSLEKMKEYIAEAEKGS